MKTVTASAPCRVDFAGGTLDLWPLYAFMGEAVTVNHAISLRPGVTLRAREKGERSLVVSQDLGLQLEIEAQHPLADEGPLALAALAVRAIPPAEPLHIELQSPVPKGSGLGASSTLLIALLHALLAWRGESRPEGDLVALARDLEARLILVPTGTQDYWAAIRGGLLGIHYSPGRTELSALAPSDDFRAWLQERSMVFFTGAAHFSAAPNWEMLKHFIEDQGETRAIFEEIRAAAFRLHQAVQNSDRDGFLAGMRREWRARTRLSDAVAPVRIVEVMERLTGAGVIAQKLCGAGGGGCMICLVEPSDQAAVKAIADAHGFRDLGAKLENAGVQVTVH